MHRIDPIIAIVDDDAVAREATADLVSSLGYDARTFSSAQAFLESGQLDRASCLITDLQMPGLSGLDLQRRLLTDGYRIPVIFITAFPNEYSRCQALSAGAIAFLIKPFAEGILIRSLELALTRGGPLGPN